MWLDEGKRRIDQFQELFTDRCVDFAKQRATFRIVAKPFEESQGAETILQLELKRPGLKADHSPYVEIYLQFPIRRHYMLLS
jgi:hypothetical protein